MEFIYRGGSCECGYGICTWETNVAKSTFAYFMHKETFYNV